MGREADRERKTAAAVTMAVWVIVFGLLLVPQSYFRGLPSLAISLNVATSFVLSLMASAAVYRLAGGVRPSPAARRYLLVFGIVALLGLALALADTAKDVLFMQWIEGKPPEQNLVLYTAGGFAFFTQGLAINAGFYLILRGGADLRARDQELAEVRDRATRAELAAAHAETAATNARLAALRYQLNPHFLFNTLNAISSMVVTNRPAAAEGMLTKLSEFLRGTLASKPDALVPFEDELASVANYLEIEGYRLRERLSFEVDCPADLADAPVPSFILQPLIENAVKHGVAPTSRAVTIVVRARRQDDALVVEVTDNGGGVGASSGFGLGLQNVRERLQSAYGDAARLDTARLSPGFQATLRLPLVRADRRFAA